VSAERLKMVLVVIYLMIDTWVVPIEFPILSFMIAGFGLAAFPVSYGKSAVISFIVNHQGQIYQKNLGPKTADIAKVMKVFNPNQGWEPVMLSD